MANREILTRKDEHIDAALQQLARPSSPFDGWRFEHCALPEIDLDEIDLSTEFLGQRLALPFVISSMTGGPSRGEQINVNLAMAAEALGIPLAVGSQRVAIETASDRGLNRRLRAAAPAAVIWANLGAAQLVAGYGQAEARRAVDMVEASALIVHLNPLQEALQRGGDTRWRGVLGAIAQLVRDLAVPIIVKEVGFGVSPSVARRLAEAGVAAIDVAGAGGTDWAAIETSRAPPGPDREVGAAFHNWGAPTPEALLGVRLACPTLPLIGSGGVRDGVDAAKALSMGADLVGQAGGVLGAALASHLAVIDHFKVMARQLRIACFCTGSPNLAGLRIAALTRA